MNPYIFRFKVTPNPDNQHYDELVGAYATVCVMETTKEKAKTRALRYLSAYLWDVEKVEDELEPTLEQIAQSDAAIQGLFRKAQKFGVGALLDAARRIQGAPDDPIEIWIEPSLFPPKG